MNMTSEDWENFLLRKRFDGERMWLSVPETARLLYVAQETVRNYCKRGELDYVRVGARNVIRIPLRALAEWLAEHPGAIDPNYP